MRKLMVGVDVGLLRVEKYSKPTKMAGADKKVKIFVSLLPHAH